MDGDLTKKRSPDSTITIPKKTIRTTTTTTTATATAITTTATNTTAITTEPLSRFQSILDAIRGISPPPLFSVLRSLPSPPLPLASSLSPSISPIPGDIDTLLPLVLPPSPPLVVTDRITGIKKPLPVPPVSQRIYSVSKPLPIPVPSKRCIHTTDSSENTAIHTDTKTDTVSTPLPPKTSRVLTSHWTQTVEVLAGVRECRWMADKETAGVVGYTVDGTSKLYVGEKTLIQFLFAADAPSNHPALSGRPIPEGDGFLVTETTSNIQTNGNSAPHKYLVRKGSVHATSDMRVVGMARDLIRDLTDALQICASGDGFTTDANQYGKEDVDTDALLLAAWSLWDASMIGSHYDPSIVSLNHDPYFVGSHYGICDNTPNSVTAVADSTSNRYADDGGNDFPMIGFSQTHGTKTTTFVPFAAREALALESLACRIIGTSKRFLAPIEGNDQPPINVGLTAGVRPIATILRNSLGLTEPQSVSGVSPRSSSVSLSSSYSSSAEFFTPIPPFSERIDKRAALPFSIPLRESWSDFTTDKKAPRQSPRDPHTFGPVDIPSPAISPSAFTLKRLREAMVENHSPPNTGFVSLSVSRDNLGYDSQEPVSGHGIEVGAFDIGSRGIDTDPFDTDKKYITERQGKNWYQGRKATKFDAGGWYHQHRDETIACEKIESFTHGVSDDHLLIEPDDFERPVSDPDDIEHGWVDTDLFDSAYKDTTKFVNHSTCEFVGARGSLGPERFRIINNYMTQ